MIEAMTPLVSWRAVQGDDKQADRIMEGVPRAARTQGGSSKFCCGAWTRLSRSDSLSGYWTVNSSLPGGEGGVAFIPTRAQPDQRQGGISEQSALRLGRSRSPGAWVCLR